MGIAPKMLPEKIKRLPIIGGRLPLCCFFAHNICLRLPRCRRAPLYCASNTLALCQ